MQELHQLIGIKFLTSGFLEIFSSLFHFPGGGANAHFTLHADAHG